MASLYQPDWINGTVTLTSGATAFTVVDADLVAIGVQPGDEIYSTTTGRWLIIDSVTDSTHGVLAYACPADLAGADLPLRIRFQPDGSRFAAAYLNVLRKFSSGVLGALTFGVNNAAAALRWAFYVGNAETGGNVGSDLVVGRYDDSGNIVEGAVVIRRSDGRVAIPRRFYTGDLLDETYVIDTNVLTSRKIDDASGSGNAHGFSESSNFSRSGDAAFCAYDIETQYSGSVDFFHFAAAQNAFKFNGSGTLQYLYGFVDVASVNSGTVVNRYGLDVFDAQGAGTVENQAGIHIRSLVRGTTTNYAILIDGPNPIKMGGYIIFPATQVASTDPNALDDYVEGGDDWTPVVSATAGAITAFSITAKRYTKIGNVVHFSATFTVTTNGTGSGVLQLSLPKACGSVDAACQGIITSGLQCWAGITANTSQLLLLKYDGTYPATDGARFIVSGTYMVD